MDNRASTQRVKLFRPFFALVLGLNHKTYPSRHRLQDFLRNLALGKRKIPIIPTAIERLEEFMQKVAPMTCGHELIRLGGEADGGYLVPDDLEDISACFSPGVGNTSAFDLDIANKGIRVFMADASVEGPAAEHELFHFRKKYIGSKEGMLTLEQWITEEDIGEEEDLLLQMDIEGAEYHNLLELPDEQLRRMRIIVLEAHHLDLMWSEGFFEIVEATFDKLLRHHLCVHIHPQNNVLPFEHKGIQIPRTMEFTFLHRDRLGVHNPIGVNTLPHPLDSSVAPFKPPLNLPKCWMKNK